MSGQSKVVQARASFNGGELSPLIAGRIDIAKFPTACARMEGFLPTTQGPAIARPGFRFVAEVKDSTDRTWLVRFERAIDQAYMLEFGDGYVRFYRDRAPLLSGGVPYEIASPYTAAQLTNSDGTFALRYAQTGDVIYLVHPSLPVYKLSRFADTTWTLAAVDFQPPPFAPLNDSATTIYASAATGSITLNASNTIFSAAMIGQYVYLGEKSVRTVQMWEPGKVVAVNDVRRSDGKNYLALDAGTTGSIKPTHSEGAFPDGDTVRWQFLDPGYGFVKITGFASTTVVSGTVVGRIPVNAVGAGEASTRWAFEAWNPTDGYPTNVTFFRERLVFARDSTVWFSVVGDFENFAYELDGSITADSGFDRVIASDRTNDIRWMSPGDLLLIGTLGDEWAIVESTTSDPFGPDNARTKRQSTYGSSQVMPQRVGEDTMFVQKAGRKVRSMAFQFEKDGFASADITVFAEHITKPGIVDLAFAQEPWPMLWACKSDGELIGCLYSREQDVVAWHRHPMPGTIVETVETLPSPDVSRDDLWIIGRYTINGATKRYVGYLEAEADELTDQDDWFYVDMGKTVTNASPSTAVTGLGHLEGAEVWVLADGAVHPNRTVSGGAITLQIPATKVHVGLPSPAVLETLDLDPQRIGLMKRLHRLVIRVLRSLGGRAGATASNTFEMRYRSPSDPMGSAPPPFTGDAEMSWEGDFGRKQTIVVVKDKPTPVNVVALFPPSDG